MGTPIDEIMIQDLGENSSISSGFAGIAGYGRMCKIKGLPTFSCLMICFIDSFEQEIIGWMSLHIIVIMLRHPLAMLELSVNATGSE